MGRIGSYDVWQVYDHETLNDDDLLMFAKSLFKEGFIKVSTVYDKDTDTVKTRYDMTAIREDKSSQKENDTKTLDTEDDCSSENEGFGKRFLKLFK